MSSEPTFTLLCRKEGQTLRERLPLEVAGQATDPVSKAGWLVRDLQAKAAEFAQIDADRVKLLYCGRLIDMAAAAGDASLASYGVKKGSTVHVLISPPSAKADAESGPPPRHEYSEESLKQFFVSMEMALRTTNASTLGQVVKRMTMTDRDSLESLSATCPGLAKDPVALALLSKPEVLFMLLKPDVLKRLSRDHPSLCQAMENLIATVHEENQRESQSQSASVSASTSQPRQPGRRGEHLVSALSYHLDELSDEDDEGDDNDGTMAEEDHSLQRNRSFSVITPDQLAQAIQAAQQSNRAGGSGSAGAAAGAGEGTGGLFQGMTGLGPAAERNSSTSSASTSQGGSGAASAPNSAASVITSDMFRQAIEQAMASTSTGGSGGGGAGTSAMDTSEPVPSASASSAAAAATGTATEADMEKNIATMKEMGIVDEGLARKALNVMGGDIQAAIDLIFSGWLGQDESAD